MSDERRQFQRLTLTDPLDAWFGDWDVRILNISAVGALIESEEPIPDDAHGLLRFWWRGEEIELLAKTARQLAIQTGLEFLDQSDVLNNLITASATELLLAQQANAMGERDANLIGDQTLTAASASRISGYVTWTLGDSGWHARRSLLPDQPANGFTIAAGEPEDQVALLCQTYESGDTESRRLTRMLAEISVAGSG